jgi:hypothetical protein
MGETRVINSPGRRKPGHPPREKDLGEAGGDVPAERLFSCMNFMKCDRRNRLGEMHLNTTVRLFTSRYKIDGFPYEKALDIFLSGKPRRGLTAQAKGKKRTAAVAFDASVLNEISRYMEEISEESE